MFLMQAVRPRGSGLAGSVCDVGGSKSVLTRGWYQPANCITWGWLAWQVSPM